MPAHPEEFHSLAAPDRDAIAALRPLLDPVKGTEPGPLMRASSNTMMEQTPAALGVGYEAATVGGVAGWWCRPAHNRAPASAVLYLHGGAYVLGSAYHYRHFVGQMAARAGVDFFIADYRVAPEHPFPAAVEDAQAAYRGLVGLGKRRLAVAGDSAGGGLALVTLARATDAAATAPTALAPHAGVALSPWTDLTQTSDSMRTRAAADYLVTPAWLSSNAADYLRGHDAHDPLASPLYGNLTGLPPLLFHVGNDEVLRDDSVRYVERARAAGVAAELHVWEGLGHVFPASVATLEAARQALDMVGAFLAGQLG